jgi:thymidine phosphorylase
VELGAELLTSSGVESDGQRARKKIRQAIQGGAALKRLEEMVANQDGDLNARRELARQRQVLANEGGFVSRINTDRIGLAVIEMGGGRKQLGETIDHSVGVEFLVRIGDKIEAGDRIANIFCNDSKTADYASELIRLSIGVGSDAVESPSLITERL